jgi:hypothetical protein
MAIVSANGVATPLSPNAIINGAFDINQRNFSSSTAGGFGFDRWNTAVSGGTVTSSAQTFIPGSGAVTGVEARNFYRITTSGQSSTGHFALLIQNVEDVRTFAGQTVTLSFYAKAGSGTPKIAGEFYQYFGTGGSPSGVVETPIGASTISTSWARYSLTFVVPSISGKTIGTNNDSALAVNLWVSSGATFATRSSSIGIQNNTFDIWGVQLEAGNIATPFRRNANSIQGELAACQRYTYVINGSEGTSGNSVPIASGHYVSSSLYRATVTFPVKMRTPPSLTSSSGAGHFQIFDSSATAYSSVGQDFSAPNASILQVTVSGRTAGQGAYLRTDNAAAQLIFSAEL